MTWIQKLMWMGWIVLLWTHSLNASTGDDDVDALLEMSLEELMDLDVYSASKSPMKSYQAPGTVYVFKGDQLRREGIVTIEDLLRVIPGVQLSPNQEGHIALRFRGVGVRFNSKVLLMIDNVPMKDIYSGNFKIDEMHPIEQIDQIEVLLGPGGVLFGAGAFGGVISITTKRGVNDLSLGYHTDQTYTGATNLHYKGLSVFAKHLKTHNEFVADRGDDGDLRIYPQDSHRELNILDLKYEPINDLIFHLGITGEEYPKPYSEDDRTEMMNRHPLIASLHLTRGDPNVVKLNLTAYHVDYPFGKQRYQIDDDDYLPKRTRDWIYDTRYTGIDLYLSRQFDRHTVLFGASYLNHHGVDQMLFTEIDYEGVVYGNWINNTHLFMT